MEEAEAKIQGVIEVLEFSRAKLNTDERMQVPDNEDYGIQRHDYKSIAFPNNENIELGQLNLSNEIEIMRKALAIDITLKFKTSVKLTNTRSRRFAPLTSRGSQQYHQLLMHNPQQQLLLLQAQAQGNLTPLGIQLKGKPMESTQETISGETPNLGFGYNCNLVACEAIRVVGAGDVDFNSVSYCKRWKGKEEPRLFHHSDEMLDLEINIYEEVTRYNETRFGSSSILIKESKKFERLKKVRRNVDMEEKLGLFDEESGRRVIRCCSRGFEEWRSLWINGSQPSNRPFWACVVHPEVGHDDSHKHNGSTTIGTMRALRRLYNRRIFYYQNFFKGVGKKKGC
eukprot:Gb_31602 [translate_table: standard]